MRVLAKYLTIIFLARFVFLLIGIAVFILSLDLVTNARAVVDSTQGSITAVAKYAVLRMPQIVSETTKFASLFAALLTFMSLMRHNQLAPIWSGGISQFGVIRRLAPVALAVGLAQFLIDAALVPHTNAALQEWGVVEQDAFQKRNARSAHSATWIKVDNDIIRIPPGMMKGRTLTDIVIFQRDDAGKLVARLSVSTARPAEVGWVLEGVTRRSINGTLEKIDRLSGWGIGFKPKSFAELTLHPRELAFNRLLGFVRAEAHGLWAPHLYRLWLQERLAVCFVPLLMICIVVALSQRFQRTGRTEFLFLVGLALGFAFFITNGIGLAMGEVGLLPPVVAAWAAIAGFAAIAGAIAFSREVHDAAPRRIEARVA